MHFTILRHTGWEIQHGRSSKMIADCRNTISLNFRSKWARNCNRWHTSPHIFTMGIITHIPHLHSILVDRELIHFNDLRVPPSISNPYWQQSRQKCSGDVCTYNTRCGSFLDMAMVAETLVYWTWRCNWLIKRLCLWLSHPPKSARGNLPLALSPFLAALLSR